ncbi:MAG: MFS transporter [Planctomycetota bacterium]
MGVLQRLTLHRPETRAWALYDWANSAYFTVIVAAVFPYYFNEVAGADLADGEATRRYSLITSASMVLVALLAPVLGAMADYAGARKKLLGLFLALGVAATACMFFVYEGDWRLGGALVLLGNVGIVGSIVCYDGLLAHVAREDEIDRLSTTGYGLGYLGGGLLLGLNIAWIGNPELLGLPVGDDLSPAQKTLPVRLAFLSVAVWWALFSIPLFLRVPEPAAVADADERAGGAVLSTAFRRLRETLRELRGYRHAFVLLLASLVYGEGIGTIIKMAGAYAADLELDRNAVFVAFFLTQFIGIPFAVLFGWLAGRIGARGAIYITLAVYVGVCIYGFFLETERDFYVLALTVGMVQGGAQALSRSLFARLIPAHKSTEFFGFFAFASKLAGSVGPFVFFAIGEAMGSNRYAILGLFFFFVLGGFLLSRVDVRAGELAAREAEDRLAG